MKQSRNSIDARLAAWFERRTADSGARRVATLSAAVGTDVGMVREENQDRVAMARGLDRSGRPYVAIALADGIGGMKQGARCAAMALGGFFASLDDDANAGSDLRVWLVRAAERANRNIHSEFSGTGGSTLVAALLVMGQPAQWLSVGDSRVHLSRGSELNQVSKDDTIAGQLGKPPEAGLDRSNLLQFIGIGAQLEPHVGEFPRGSTGSILLTSDGAHFMESRSMAGITGHAPDGGTCVRRLIELAKWCGGPDNASVGIISMDAAIDRGNPDLELSLEIWDPFGEVQLIFRTPPASLISAAPARATAQADALPVADQKPLEKAKKFRARKQKPKLEPETDVRSADPITEPPQLRIEFPNKVA